MLPWKLRKRQILPVKQNLSSVYFSLAKFQLVSCNLFLAMTWQMTYTHKLPKLCSATLRAQPTLWTWWFVLALILFFLAFLVLKQSWPACDSNCYLFDSSHKVGDTKDSYTQGGYSHTLPIWVCAAQASRDFEVPDLERGIHFRGVF